jgi:PD-(D/E)XK nuclease superfamily protein
LKTPGMKIRNPKQRGEWAELRFMAKAAELGFKLNKPFGDSAPYDVVIDLDDRFVRVQVKCTYSRIRERNPHRRRGTFIALLRSPRHPYQLSDFEYLAVYVIPKDAWYIIPAAIALAKGSVCVRPGCSANRFERYREGWHLLGGFENTDHPRDTLLEPRSCRMESHP